MGNPKRLEDLLSKTLKRRITEPASKKLLRKISIFYLVFLSPIILQAQTCEKKAIFTRQTLYMSFNLASNLFQLF
tara:strand:+ start:2173 stop:2397 length:225 start_codon:yes stop_codon:yes gene_type:complete